MSSLRPAIAARDRTDVSWVARCRSALRGDEKADLVVARVERGDVAALRDIVDRGVRIDERTRRSPWVTPLDVAAARSDLACAALLLDASAPISGSAIFHAIGADAYRILELFHEHDPQFHRLFDRDPHLGANPRLDRWLHHYTALDYAMHMDAQSCVGFLSGIEAPKAPVARRCRNGHYAPRVSSLMFIAFGGTYIDGLCEFAEGYCCARCWEFERTG